jgi:hypothetical protein
VSGGRRYSTAGLALAMLFAGCGGGASDKQKAVDVLKRQTIPVGPGGSNVAPSKVDCNSAGSHCTVTYPDGQAQNCSVAVSDNSNSVSCVVKATPAKPLPKPSIPCNQAAIEQASAEVGACSAARGITLRYAKPGTPLTLDALSAQVNEVKLAQGFHFSGQGGSSATGSDKELRLVITITNRSSRAQDLTTIDGQLAVHAISNGVTTSPTDADPRDFVHLRQLAPGKSATGAVTFVVDRKSADAFRSHGGLLEIANWNQDVTGNSFTPARGVTVIRLS